MWENKKTNETIEQQVYFSILIQTENQQLEARRKENTQTTSYDSTHNPFFPSSFYDI